MLQQKILEAVDWALPFDPNLNAVPRPWDPYLMWAIATAFRGYSQWPPGGSQNPPVVALLLELDKIYQDLNALKQRIGGVPSLNVPDMYFFDHPQSVFVTATVLRSELDVLLASPAVRRAQLSLPRVPDGQKDVHIDVRHLLARQLVIGVIDDRCAYAQRKFRKADGSTRIASVWNQSGQGGPAPSGPGYGQVRRRDAATPPRLQPTAHSPSLGDDEWYRDPDVSDGRLWPRTLHGTHVLDIAAGSPCPALVDAVRGPGADDAASAELVFVELPEATVADVSGASLGNAALDGLRYILKQAPELDTNLVVNFSYGHFAGSHDETGLFTSAVTDLLNKRDNFAITVPAGNGVLEGRPIHASCASLAPLATAALGFTVIPRDLVPTFVEVWVPETAVDGSSAQLAFSLKAPDGAVLGPLTVGQGGLLVDTTGPARVLAGLSYFRKAVQGTRGRMALISVEPTISADGAPFAQSGTWEIRVTNQGGLAVSNLHAWVERHDALPGAPNQGRQPHFVGIPGGLFQVGGLGYTLNAIAHGPLTLCAGGLMRQVSPAHTPGPSKNRNPKYAGRGPGRDDAAAGFDAAPVAQVLSDASPVLAGVRAAGSHSGSTVRLSGTSASSALLARVVANTLQAAAPTPAHRIAASVIRGWFPAPSGGLATRQIDETLAQQPFP